MANLKKLFKLSDLEKLPSLDSHYYPQFNLSPEDLLTEKEKKERQDYQSGHLNSPLLHFPHFLK
jgi:hypothetical protein